MAIASPQIVSGGTSAPSALHPYPISRTIADGVPGFVEGRHAKAP
jgi:hypothetical protein